ncbi:MAG TPA: hypothetical protein VFN48_05465 [Solirubrobacteraceae bacterium]|nr:hypothetical protein [Solirubrobacteraceae bacterium]
MLPRTKLLAGVGVLVAAAVPVSVAAASGGSHSAATHSAAPANAAHAAVTHCKNVLLSESSGAESFNVHARGVSCSAAAGLEHHDYAKAANTRRTMVVSFSGWRCTNTRRTFTGNVPYVAVSCSASHARALSFSFQNT